MSGRGCGDEAEVGDLVFHPARKVPSSSLNIEEGRKNRSHMMRVAKRTGWEMILKHGNWNAWLI